MTCPGSPGPGRWIPLAGSLLLVLPGLFFGPMGALDPVAFLTWCALVGPSIGALISVTLPGPSAGLDRLGGRVEQIVSLCLPPVFIATALFGCQVLGQRALGQPLAGLCVVTGFYSLGCAIGVTRQALRPSSSSGNRLYSSLPLVGSLQLISLALAGAPRLFGLAGTGQTLGHSHPTWAVRFLDLAPDGFALEASGFDWSHSNPMVYGVSGIEWVQRAPRGGWDALAWLGICLLALVAAYGYARRHSPPHSGI